MKIFETIYEGTVEELAAYEKARKSSECTVDLKLNTSDLEKKITDNVANNISDAVANSIDTQVDINEVMKCLPNSLQAILKFAEIQDYSSAMLLTLAFPKNYAFLVTNELRKNFEDFISQKLNKKVITNIIIKDK